MECPNKNCHFQWTSIIFGSSDCDLFSILSQSPAIIEMIDCESYCDRFMFPAYSDNAKVIINSSIIHGSILFFGNISFHATQSVFIEVDIKLTSSIAEKYKKTSQKAFSICENEESFLNLSTVKMIKCALINSSLELNSISYIYITNSKFIGGSKTPNCLELKACNPQLSVNQCTNVTINSGTFTKATLGALSFNFNKNILVNNCNFTDNKKELLPKGGGAIYATASSILLISCNFFNNYALLGSSILEDEGGKMAIIQIRNCTVIIPTTKI